MSTTRTHEVIFHIYDNNNKIIKHSLTVDEMEKMIAERKVDWKHWQIEPCYTEYNVEDASF